MQPCRSDNRSRARLPVEWPLGRPLVGIRYLPFLLAAVLITALSLHPDSALAAAKAASSAPRDPAGKSDGGARLDTVTIQTARETRELRRQVGRFVFSVVVSNLSESLPRWNEPICPLVAGLPREQGEYILARITHVATAAHAPLAGRHCKANLYVIATPYPDLLLKKWWARDRLMYDECDGLAGVKLFLDSKQPIRAWYNIMPGGPNGGRGIPIHLDTPSTGLNLGPNAGCIGGGDGGSRVVQPTIQLRQAIIVVDMRKINDITIGQLADYVSMAGLAQIQPDSRPAAGPSILTLFRNDKHPPQGLSAWDRALLYALYHARQSDPLQVSLMENSMVSRITRSR